MSFGPPEEPDDIPDPLERKPLGFCPSCDKALDPPDCEQTSVGDPEGLYAGEGECDEPWPSCTCSWWDYESSEAENRIRYAAEKIESAQIGERIIRESRKYGAGREV